jgi:hypothetical protein
MKWLLPTALVALATILYACSGGGYGNGNGAPASGGSLPDGTTFFTVSVPNAPNAYTINGVQNPSIILHKNITYTFDVSAVGTGHPFWIKSTQGAGTSGAYTSGVINNGATSGQIQFTVPSGAPNFLYYDCENHRAMSGVISIEN